MEPWRREQTEALVDLFLVQRVEGADAQSHLLGPDAGVQSRLPASKERAPSPATTSGASSTSSGPATRTPCTAPSRIDQTFDHAAAYQGDPGASRLLGQPAVEHAAGRASPRPAEAVGRRRLNGTSWWWRSRRPPRSGPASPPRVPRAPDPRSRGSAPRAPDTRRACRRTCSWSRAVLPAPSSRVFDALTRQRQGGGGAGRAGADHDGVELSPRHRATALSGG